MPVYVRVVVSSHENLVHDDLNSGYNNIQATIPYDAGGSGSALVYSCPH